MFVTPSGEQRKNRSAQSAWRLLQIGQRNSRIPGYIDIVQLSSYCKKKTLCDAEHAFLYQSLGDDNKAYIINIYFNTGIKYKLHLNMITNLTN